MKRRGVGLLVAALLLCACQTVPPYAKGEVEGQGFHHVYFGTRGAGGDTVHLYIEGDGRPVVNRTRIASDPTPRASIVLRWMLDDPAPSYYLGRPCYFGMAARDACDSRWWTTERYAPAVVESMVAAARRLLAGRPVVLIGYSGGGTLAVAMAGELDNVRGLVTVAGNLNVQGWTTHHGYTPLTPPGDGRALLRRVRTVPQRHYVGGRDRNVLPDLTFGLSDAAAADSVCVMRRWDHECCWVARWPQLVDLGANTCESVGGTVYSPSVSRSPAQGSSMDESGAEP